MTSLSNDPFEPFREAVTAAYAGSAYGVEPTADGVVLHFDPSVSLGEPPLTTGTRRTFRLIVTAEPATKTYTYGVRTLGAEWQLPGASSNGVTVTRGPERIKISAKLAGTTFDGGTGSQEFTYDTNTDAARVEAAVAPLGWTRRRRGPNIRKLLTWIFGGVAAALVVVFGILLLTGAL